MKFRGDTSSAENKLQVDGDPPSPPAAIENYNKNQAAAGKPVSCAESDKGEVENEC